MKMQIINPVVFKKINDTGRKMDKIRKSHQEFGFPGSFKNKECEQQKNQKCTPKSSMSGINSLFLQLNFPTAR